MVFIEFMATEVVVERWVKIMKDEVSCIFLENSFK